ncbi:DinB family protein [Deinococcus radiomollis]|uniref:mycothiol transferase n=1 Tax=Deinococcus radiomollis TaxID=468916 RepID=UPI00389144C5
MTNADPHRNVRLLPSAEYSPRIGTLVEMMAYARMTTLQAVEGMSVSELDAIPPGFSNSVGMLLAHIAAVDRLYQIASFQGLNPYQTAEFQPYLGAMTFGKRGEKVVGRSLESLLADLETARAVTLAELAKQGDAWLDSVMGAWPDFLPNQHWAWFHVMEDEVSHRGQIRVVRKAVQQTAQD